MRLGLISDTHGKLRPEVFRHFDRVDRILHAGDVGSLELIAELEALAPVTAVWGNMDGFEVRTRLHETAAVDVEDRRILLVHGHRTGSPTPERLHAAYPEGDVVVYGHTHIPLVQRLAGRLFVNPGAAGPARFGRRPSVGLLTVTDRYVDARLIEL